MEVWSHSEMILESTGVTLAGETHAGVITEQYLSIIEVRTADKESVFLFKARP